MTQDAKSSYMLIVPPTDEGFHDQDQVSVDSSSVPVQNCPLRYLSTFAVFLQMKVFMNGIDEMTNDQDELSPPVAILSPVSSSPTLIKTFYTSRKYLLLGHYTLRQKFIGNQTFHLHLHTDWGWYRGE